MKKCGYYLKLYKELIWIKEWGCINRFVKKNLRLPQIRHGIYFFWESENPNLISNQGVINWDNVVSKNEKMSFEVTLKVYETYFADDFVKTKPIKAKLNFEIRNLSEEDRIEKSIKEITYDRILGANNNPNNVISNLELPKKTSYGIPIKWKSNNSCINDLGIVNRKNNNQTVEIIACYNGKKIKKETKYHFVVKKRDLSKERVLFMVPHGDDEIYLAYSILRNAIVCNKNVYVCFFCNNDTKGKEKTKERHKQIIRVMGYYGVNIENIIILGYSTKWKNKHIYDADSTVESINGDRMTYGTKLLVDWHTKRYGIPASYTKQSVIDDIKDVISIIRPNYIFCNDMDNHLDHIAYSLLFEQAVGEILKEIPRYKPIIYKGFCYGTSAYAKSNLFNLVISNTKRPSKKEGCFLNKMEQTELDNPSYLWRDRKRFKTVEECLNKNIDKNPATRAIKMYERMYRNIPCFIHTDQVFWMRDTRGISYQAEITVSSGNSYYLNDFKLTDVKNLSKQPIRFQYGEWVPNRDDYEKTIVYRWDKKHNINRIRFYRNINEKYIKKIRIFIDSDYKDFVLFENGEKPYKDINFTCTTKIIKIKILDFTSYKAGFTEIEIY